MKNKILLSIFLFSFISLQAQEEQLVYSIPVFTPKSKSSLILSSTQGWMEVGNVASSLMAAAPKPKTGSLRKWRVRATYSDFETHTRATIEMLLQPTDSKPVVFVLPWQNRTVTIAQKEASNWFIPYNAEEGKLFQGSASCSVRLISEPGGQSTAQVKEVFLEAWDIDIARNQLLAKGPAIPNISDENNKQQVYAQDALQFSLDFVKYGLNGELPKYYYVQNSTVYGLEDGKPYGKYRWAPPQIDYGDVNQDLYVKNYKFHIYDKQQMEQMYPEWFSSRREWKPNRSSFLFVGDQVRIGGTDFVKDNILMFVVEYKDNRWQVAARPLNK